MKEWWNEKDLLDIITERCLHKELSLNEIVNFKQSVDKVGSLRNIQKILPGHNDLNVPIHTIEKVKEAFEHLEKSNLLVQGSGIFKFESFSIHI